MGKGFSDPIDRSVTRTGCIIRWQINGLPREEGMGGGDRGKGGRGMHWGLLLCGRVPCLLPMKINTEEGCLLLLRGTLPLDSLEWHKFIESYVVLPWDPHYQLDSESMPY